MVFCGKSSKPFFQLSNQWSIMQYLNFVSKKNRFISRIYLQITVFVGFLWLLINCFKSKRSNFSLLLLFLSLQLSLHSSLRLTVQIYPGCQNPFTLEISFLLFFHNQLFQNMLINLAGKESPQHVLLNI